MKIVKCDYCGVDFEKPNCEVNKRNYCNVSCHRAAMSSGSFSLERRNGKSLPCDVCGKIIYVVKSKLKLYKNHFCSLKCSGEWTSKNRIGENAYNFKGKTIEKACLICGKTFFTHVGKKYCCTKCGDIGRKKQIILKCLCCNKEFSIVCGSGGVIFWP